MVVGFGGMPGEIHSWQNRVKHGYSRRRQHSDEGGEHSMGQSVRELVIFGSRGNSSSVSVEYTTNKLLS